MQWKPDTPERLPKIAMATALSENAPSSSGEPAYTSQHVPYTSQCIKCFKCTSKPHLNPSRTGKPETHIQACLTESFSRILLSQICKCYQCSPALVSKYFHSTVDACPISPLLAELLSRLMQRANLGVSTLKATRLFCCLIPAVSIALWQTTLGHLFKVYNQHAQEFSAHCQYQGQPDHVRHGWSSGIQCSSVSALCTLTAEPLALLCCCNCCSTVNRWSHLKWKIV